MTVIADAQRLEPGDRVLLFELDLTSIGGDVLRFHPYAQLSTITFQAKVYTPWAVEAEGLGRTGDVQQPAPTLRVGNIGVDADGKPVPGFISSLCINLQDMVGAQITIHETFGKYLDGQPTADPTQEYAPEVWFIQQKSSEGPDVVEFELSGHMALDGLQLPRRSIQASVCPWLYIGGYRGPYCQYSGAVYFTDQDVPTTDPVQDKCGGRVLSCQLRFGAQQSVAPIAAELSYGGFPAADRLR